ncbi:MAG: TonB-dependent receptor [Acidobacteria bacterium]|nr:TonB-dependent receptor [Acidobacteriota bacterium]
MKPTITRTLKSCLLALILAGGGMEKMGNAQVTTGTILGQVKDQTGAVLPGVTVTIRHTESGLTRTVLTSESGFYRATNLSVGGYEVRAELAGFQPVVRRGIELTVGREAVVNFILEIGEMSEELVVTGEASLVDTTKSTLSALVEEKTIRDLPLNGRSFDQLARLQPGVHAIHNVGTALEQGRGQQMSIGGARPQQNNFSMDGTSINNHNNSTPGSAGGTVYGVDVIREFEILTVNYSAEYGNSGGGLINVVTKSGTNDWHGTAFAFHRNDNLDAKNFFDKVDKPKPEFKRNQFGGTVGGPILRSKTFFLVGYEGLRERLGVSQIASVPNVQAREGLLPNPRTRVLERVTVHPSIIPFLKLFPLPNGRDFGNGAAEHIFARSNPTDEDFLTTRVDHLLSEKDSFFARYTLTDGSVGRVRALPAFALRTISRYQYTTLEHKRVFSPSFLNVFRFGFNRTTLTDADESTETVDPSLRWFPGLPFGSFLFRADLTNLGPEGGPPDRRFLTNEFSWEDVVSLTRGKHSVRFGAVAKRYQWNSVNTFRLKGEFTFDNIESFLRGAPSSFQARTFRNPGAGINFNPARGYRQSVFAFYAQDDLRLRPNFTLNLGLRYEPTTGIVEQHDRIANFRSLNDQDFTFGQPFVANPSLRNFNPRLGFAWDVFSDGKTSLRGGFGLFFDPTSWFFMLNSPLDTVSATLVSPRFPQVLDAILASKDPELRGVEFHAGTPYYQKFSLGIQREIPGKVVVSLEYLGSHGAKLFRVRDINTALPIVIPGARKFFPAGATRRNPNLGPFGLRTADVNSNYSSLQAALRKRFEKDLQFQASYTFSKSIDEAAGQFNSFTRTEQGAPVDSDERSNEQGHSSFDVRHSFVANWTYDLPLGRGRRWLGSAKGFLPYLLGGWSLNGIVTVAAGSPFTIENSFNRSRTLALGITLADRPDLKAGASNNPVLGGPDRYFDPVAFTLQPAGNIGTLGRNTVIGPGFASTDFSLFKNNQVTEKVNLQFRAEFFNLLNRPNFNSPGTTGRRVFTNASGVPSGQAGRLTETVGFSRQVQLGLKLIF